MLQEKVLLPDALYNSHQLLVKKKKKEASNLKSNLAARRNLEEQFWFNGDHLTWQRLLLSC